MTTEPTSTPSTVLEELAERMGLSWLQITVVVGLVLILLLGVAAYVDGAGARPLHPYSASDWWHGVREEVDRPAIIVYILLAYHLVGQSSGSALAAFRGLMGMGNDDFGRLVAETSPLSRRGEWLALGIGAASGLLIYRPWSLPEHFFWMKLYTVLAVTVMFGLLGWISYVSLAGSRQFAELHRQLLDVDVFDPTPFEPIARLGLGISLAFIGGVTLSVLFNPDPREFFSIESLMTYGTSILVAVLVFFLTTLDTHRVMAKAKEEKLKLVRRHLSDAFQQLQQRAAEAQPQDMETLSDSITAWLAYEKRIEDAPGWPYTTSTLRNLLVSTLLPVGARAARIIIAFIR